LMDACLSSFFDGCLPVILLWWMLACHPSLMDACLSSFFDGCLPVILLWWMLACHPSLMDACLLRSPRMNHSSFFFFVGGPAILLFCLKTCHPFYWMTISALFLFTPFEGNLRESLFRRGCDSSPHYGMTWLLHFLSTPSHSFWLFLFFLLSRIHYSSPPCSLPSVKKNLVGRVSSGDLFPYGTVSYSSLFISILVKIYA
jgi:hypothetical protein